MTKPRSKQADAPLTRREVIRYAGIFAGGAAVLGGAAFAGAYTLTRQNQPAPRSGTTSDQPAVDFSARFAGFQAVDERDGDLSKVVWPAFILQAGGDVQELYAFQITNAALMKYMPCFCGCGSEEGHRNNRDCYIKAVNPDGSVVFDTMAPT